MVGWAWWRHQRAPFLVLPRAPPTLNTPLLTPLQLPSVYHIYIPPVTDVHVMLIPGNVGSVYYYIAVNPRSKLYSGVIRTRLEIDLFIQSVIFMPAFPLRRSRGSSPRWTQNTSRSRAISDSSDSAHWDGARRGRGCSHYTWSLDDLWVASPWV